jgi:UDPglucose--hexose-1-phosphate uridylyltransferase
MGDNRINSLIDYGIRKKLLEEADRTWAYNQILMILRADSEEDLPKTDSDPGNELHEILESLCDAALQTGALKDGGVVSRDLLDTRLMGALTPRPAQVRAEFAHRYADSPESATGWFYEFSRNTNYIRRDRIRRDVKWVTKTEYGDLDITINLSKPEKDPKAIAEARNLPQSAYPKCQLCAENEGYAGRLNHPARENHRIIPITINKSSWYFQYSPYVYYNEHCIVFNGEHVPMKIDAAAFRKLLDFVQQFPHYFVGSNADLPIVGGSILSHEHFQGGHYTFAMEKAEIEKRLISDRYSQVEAGIVKWPLSVIRLRSEDDSALAEMADEILSVWRSYSDPKAFIFAETDGEPHNTITPIARRRGDLFELDLVLRNNITTEEHPLGVFHPHAELHHIKKENIGLIEVMGLAVLPARLKKEMELLKEALLSGTDVRTDSRIAAHADWAEQLQRKYRFDADDADQILQEEIGKVFMQVLEDAGVYKRTKEGKEAFLRFCGQTGLRP